MLSYCQPLPLSQSLLQALGLKQQAPQAVNGAYVEKITALCNALAEQGALSTAEVIIKSALKTTDSSSGSEALKSRLSVATGRAKATVNYGGPVRNKSAAQPRAAPAPSTTPTGSVPGMPNTAPPSANSYRAPATTPPAATMGYSAPGTSNYYNRGPTAAVPPPVAPPPAASVNTYGMPNGGPAGAGYMAPPTNTYNSYSSPASYAGPGMTSYAPPPPVAPSPAVAAAVASTPAPSYVAPPPTSFFTPATSAPLTGPPPTTAAAPRSATVSSQPSYNNSPSAAAAAPGYMAPPSNTFAPPPAAAPAAPSYVAPPSQAPPTSFGASPMSTLAPPPVVGSVGPTSSAAAVANSNFSSAPKKEADKRWNDPPQLKHKSVRQHIYRA